MNRLRSGDAQIAYAVAGAGPPVVLLHAFPAHHALWLPAARALTARYRAILPDLRGHGESAIGEGPATMEKHALDVACVLDDAGVGRALFAGVSIGGYVLFEFWRRFRERVAGLAIVDSRAQADTPEGRANRLKAAADVMEHGPEEFLQAQIPKLLGRTTMETRPDLVEGARQMMQKMSPQAIAQVQQGMAERPDSIPTLKTIHVPTLILIGEEDTLTTTADGDLMRQHLPNCELKVISRAGHYSPWEQPEEVGRLIRQFADRLA
ncbi:MAG TPA: alpha/beta fold hydrolase [Terriglobales bacterium]|nr:alpha/beta fold hydrolase [Terriglobales bacterium]